MDGKIYISASEDLKKKIKKQNIKKYRIIYTDDISDADFILIQKQEDDTLADAQFRDLVRARELGIRVDYIKEGKLAKDVRLDAMKDTRKKFDLEIE